MSGLIVARLITPDILGEFAKYRILTGYLGIGLVLIHAGFQRNYLFYIGKGDNSEAIQIASAAKWWYLFYSWIGTIVFVTLAVKNFHEHNYRAVIGWAAQIPALWVIIYGAYLQVLFRTSGHFRKLSYIKLSTSIVYFLLLIFVKHFGYWGLASRYKVKNYVDVFLHQYFAPQKIKSVFNYQRLVKLAKVSIPLQMPSYIDTYLLTATIGYFILVNIGERDLGIYTMATTIKGFMMVFNTSMSQIVTTKISLKYGATEDIKECLKYSSVPIFLIFIVTVAISALFSIFIDHLITRFIPNYTDSIPVLQILIWMLPLSSLRMPFSLFGAALWYKTIIILRILRTISCIIFILYFQNNLIMIAWSIVLAEILFIFSGYGVLFNNIKNNTGR